MKMRLKKKNTSHKYDINRSRPRHEQKHTLYMCLSTMMVICSKKHLSNI